MNASHVTSGNSGHDVNVEADVNKTASSQMMPVKNELVNKLCIQIGRLGRRQYNPVYDRKRSEAVININIAESEVEFGMNYKRTNQLSVYTDHREIKNVIAC